MAQFKLIALIVAALFAITPEAEAKDDVQDVSRRLWVAMKEKLSPEDQANATKAFSFAEEYFKGLEKINARTAKELFTAWDRVLHKPNQCDDLSLEYVAKISKCVPLYSDAMPPSSLIQLTKEYARECLQPDYIAKEVKWRVFFMPKVKFIDKQFIADYWLDHPNDKPLKNIEGIKATKAIAKAIARYRGNKIKELKNRRKVDEFLIKHLYRPCYRHKKSLRGLMLAISSASEFLKGGKDELIASLDDKTQEKLFRLELCEHPEIWFNPGTVTDQVVSELKSLTGS